MTLIQPKADAPTQRCESNENIVLVVFLFVLLQLLPRFAAVFGRLSFRPLPLVSRLLLPAAPSRSAGCRLAVLAGACGGQSSVPSFAVGTFLFVQLDETSSTSCGLVATIRCFTLSFCYFKFRVTSSTRVQLAVV